MVNEHRSLPLDADLRADALDVLRDIQLWRLTGPRWASLRGTLDALRAAYDAGEEEALRAAVHELELSGPVRANSLGGQEFPDSPEPVRDLVNALVHDLSGDATPAPPADPS